MKAIWGMGLLLALALLIGQAGAEGPYPSWVDANGWSPYGGYTTSYIGQHYLNPYANVFNLYDPYGMWAGEAGYDHRYNMWEYNTNGMNPYGYTNQNPYRY
jgi:hypothetical protein